MKCIVHPERDAAGVCAHSGKPYCAEDLVEVNGKLYGRENIGAAMSEKVAEAEKRATASQPQQVFMNAGGASSSSSSSAAAAVGGGVGVYARKSRAMAAILAVAPMLIGLGGIHSFYTGKPINGVLQLLTIGGCFLWNAWDAFCIIVGTYRDGNGQPLA
jgi:hypothetical protein